MNYFKEAITSNNLNRNKDGEQILLENFCVVIDTKIVIKELNVEYMVPVYRTSNHGNDIMAASTCSLSVNNSFILILLDITISELISMPFWISDIEDKLLVENNG